jgi:hypothetical protein
MASFFDIPSTGEVNFVTGMKTLAGSGDPSLREGLATHIYTANHSMHTESFVNSDGDFSHSASKRQSGHPNRVWVPLCSTRRDLHYPSRVQMHGQIA